MCNTLINDFVESQRVVVVEIDFIYFLIFKITFISSYICQNEKKSFKMNRQETFLNVCKVLMLCT